jgi:hypothetical protein
MGEGWSDWFALMMQLKPGDSGRSKEVLEHLFLHKILMVWVFEHLFTLLIVCLINDLQRYKWFYFLDSNNVESTSVHGVGSVWATDVMGSYLGLY